MPVDGERFDRFMARALYAPGTGFFTSGRGAPGRRGDFLTSVEVGPLFGAVVARMLDAAWDGLGRPATFTVVDAGAGAGTLLRAVEAAAPRCAGALDLVAVEVSPVLRAMHPAEVRSVTAVPDVEAGVVVANELLDNLPVRVLERTTEGWAELHVVDGGVVLQPTDAVGPVDVPVGARIPIAEEAVAWVRSTLDRIGRGRLVVVDYGADTVELAHRPGAGWLRTYRAHGRGGPPWEDPGSQDITYDVPFDQLPGGARSTQASWRRRGGIDELVDEGRRIWTERAGVADLAALRARSRVREAEALLDPAGLGGFVVAEWERPGY